MKDDCELEQQIKQMFASAWQDGVNHLNPKYLRRDSLFTDKVMQLIKSHTAKAVLEARIDTAQFAQNLIRDALAVNADTRKISRFGATDEVLERFISELAALKQGPTNAK